MRRTTWWHDGHTGTHEAYNISCDEYVELSVRSAGRCDRCGIQYRNLVIDHDHAAGLRAVRGMLCHRCNTVMGLVDQGRAPDSVSLAYLANPFHVQLPESRPRRRPAVWPAAGPVGLPCTGPTRVAPHRNPAITPRPPAELRDRAKLAVAEVGSDLNAHIIGFLRWLVHDEAEPPKRPAKPIPKCAPKR